MALALPHDCPIVREVTLKDMGEINQYQAMAKHNKGWNMQIILGLCCTYLKFLGENQSDFNLKTPGAHFTNMD